MRDGAMPVFTSQSLHNVRVAFDACIDARIEVARGRNAHLFPRQNILSSMLSVQDPTASNTYSQPRIPWCVACVG